MAKRIVDVTVHIDESLAEPARRALENAVRDAGGVVTAAYSDSAPHLMLVEYDADRLDARALLALVESQGVRAQLIGM